MPCRSGDEHCFESVPRLLAASSYAGALARVTLSDVDTRAVCLPLSIMYVFDMACIACKQVCLLVRTAEQTSLSLIEQDHTFSTQAWSVATVAKTIISLVRFHVNSI